MRFGDEEKVKKAMGGVTALTDSVVDDELKAMAAAKRPAPVEGAAMEGMAPGALTPEEMETLKALLAKMQQSKE